METMMDARFRRHANGDMRNCSADFSCQSKSSIEVVLLCFAIKIVNGSFSV
ncbi:hypothetical protein HanIR_Chr13g0638291 [Helianthus annuus]|nr:hypothetical protein HanIR_Chr13g0638291 [Helianthus annuus]